MYKIYFLHYPFIKKKKSNNHDPCVKKYIYIPHLITNWDSTAN